MNKLESKKMSQKTPVSSQNSTTPASMPTPLFTSGMKKLILAGTILLLIALAVSLWANRSVKEPVKTAALHSASIQITSEGFLPATTTISAGQSVTWKNYDQQGHWVASDPYPSNDKLSSLNSNGPISQNSAYSYTFDKAGTYTYHDQLNPYKIQGTIVVK